MNSKGFTLVELLAVIVILSLLALITSTAVTKIVKDSKDDLSSTQMALIKSSAETWMADNLNKLPETGSCAYLTLEDLKNYGILDDNVIDPKDSNRISDELKIKITSSLSKYGNPVNSVEVNPESVAGCVEIYKSICEAVTQETATKMSDGTTPIGRVPDGTYQLGDEYRCNVDGTNNYTFFILSTAGDKVNLIMDSNIRRVGTEGAYTGEPVKETTPTEEQKGTVAWYAPADNNSYGPQTAMQYLNEATANWSNIPNLNETYTDEGPTIPSYGGSNGYASTPLNLTGKARLPKYSEVTGAECQAGIDNSCPKWLSNYLNTSSYVSHTNPVSGVYGYWTLSSYASNSRYAWIVYYSGSGNYYSVSLDVYYGVRPVITVLKSNLS